MCHLVVSFTTLIYHCGLIYLSIDISRILYGQSAWISLLTFFYGIHHIQLLNSEIFQQMHSITVSSSYI
jgi:hypothetical protein